MAQRQVKAGALDKVDPVWARIRGEAEDIVRREPELATLIYSTILHHDSLEAAVVHRVAERLDSPEVSAEMIRQAYLDALETEPAVGAAFRADIVATVDRDPATNRFLEPVLYFKGFHAIQTHRLAHWLWRRGRKDFAYYLQSRSSAVFQTDINPAVSIGRGIFLDHATGLVVGETAAIEDDVSILQEVTLGGTGKEAGDRHPKIRHGVLIGAGAEWFGGAESVGTLALDEDEEDDERSYNFEVKITLGDASASGPDIEKLDAYLKRKFDTERIRVVPRLRKKDSAEVYVGDEYI